MSKVKMRKAGDSAYVFDGYEHTNGHDHTVDERLVQAGVEIVELRKENEKLKKRLKKMKARGKK